MRGHALPVILCLAALSASADPITDLEGRVWVSSGTIGTMFTTLNTVGELFPVSGAVEFQDPYRVEWYHTDGLGANWVLRWGINGNEYLPAGYSMTLLRGQTIMAHANMGSGSSPILEGVFIERPLGGTGNIFYSQDDPDGAILEYILAVPACEPDLPSKPTDPAEGWSDTGYNEWLWNNITCVWYLKNTHSPDVPPNNSPNSPGNLNIPGQWVFEDLRWMWQYPNGTFDPDIAPKFPNTPPATPPPPAADPFISEPGTPIDPTPEGAGLLGDIVRTLQIIGQDAVAGWKSLTPSISEALAPSLNLLDDAVDILAGIRDSVLGEGEPDPDIVVDTSTIDDALAAVAPTDSRLYNPVSALAGLPNILGVFPSPPIGVPNSLMIPLGWPEFMGGPTVYHLTWTDHPWASVAYQLIELVSLVGLFLYMFKAAQEGVK